jgi:hypothetical protein
LKSEEAEELSLEEKHVSENPIPFCEYLISKFEYVIEIGGHELFSDHDAAHLLFCTLATVRRIVEASESIKTNPEWDRMLASKFRLRSLYLLLRSQSCWH